MTESPSEDDGRKPPANNEGVDPTTGEFIEPKTDEATLPHEVPALPDELKEEPQPMSPDTAKALAEAGYQLSLSGGEDEEGSTPEPAPDPSMEPFVPAPAAPLEESVPAPVEPSKEVTEETIEQGPPAPLEETQVEDTPEAPTPADEEAAGADSTDEEGLFQDEAFASPEPMGKSGLFKVLLARETLPHFGILALLMVIFLVLSFSDSKDHGDWLLTLSLGGMAAFALIAVMALTPMVDLIRNPRFGWVIPLALTLILAAVLRQVLLVDSEKAEDHRDLLALAMVGLFVLWHFMQAWWMRVPFENWALKRFAPAEGGAEGALEEAEDDWGGPVGAIDRWATRMAGKGPLLNAIAPIIWAVVGLGLFELLYKMEVFQPSEGAFFENYDNTFRLVWLGTMTVVGLLLMLVVRRMLKWAPDSGRVALFSGAFAFGFWVFLAYHAFALFWSLAQEPSFAFDLLFMLITILVAIYSLSSRAITVAGGLVRPENVLFFGIAFGISYSGANFFLISDFGGSFDPREVGYLSHLIAGLFGALVLLLANASFMNLEGHLRYGGLMGLRQGLGAVPMSAPPAADGSQDIVDDVADDTADRGDGVPGAENDLEPEPGEKPEQE